MANPKISDSGATGITDDGAMVNGRPPDGVPLVSSGPVLERPGSPLTAAVQSEAKRFRLPEEVRLAGNYTAMDVEGEPSLFEGQTRVVGLQSDSEQNPRIPRVSYANMVGRSLWKEDQLQDGVALDPNKQGTKQGGMEEAFETSTDGLFGPWMMVDNRRRKPQAMKLNSKGSEQSFRKNNGSRFAVLGAESGSPDTDQTVEVMEEGRRLSLPVRDGAIEEARDLGKTSAATAGKVVHGAYGATTAGGISNISKKAFDKAVVLPMVEGQQVSIVENPSHNKVHVAVSIFEQNHGKKAVDRVVQGKNVGGKVRGNKENVRQGLKVRKPSDTRTISRPVLSDWVDNMTSKLDNLAKDRELEPGGVDRVFVNQEGELETDSLMAVRGQVHASSSTSVQDSLQNRMDIGC
ncbi:hypothetical protein V6N12_066537 [Hibiscus sabdariffa]|uniref:Uncharacterized protein n=1 Tax=Hibiscus sabdariffa TaxID=183260 RepID=A0ABR2CQE6_9ROSI